MIAVKRRFMHYALEEMHDAARSVSNSLA